MAKSRRRRGLLGGKGQSTFGLPVDLPKPDAPDTEPEAAPTPDEPAVSDPSASSEAEAPPAVEASEPDAAEAASPPGEEANEPPPAEVAAEADAPTADELAALDPAEPIPDDSPAHDFFAVSGDQDDAFDPVVEDLPTVPMTAQQAHDDHIRGTEVREDAARTGSGYYVETGEMPADTSELGWTSDVFGRDTGPPASARAKFPAPSTPTDEGRSIAAELFSDPEADFSGELSDPPTEEVPATLARHVGGTARDTASMDLPEPPPLPGILDRFTPAPMGERSELTNRLRRNSSFEADAPSRTEQAPSGADLRPPAAVVPTEEGGAGTWWLAAGVGALAAVLLILGVQFVFRGMSAEPAPSVRPSSAPARTTTTEVPAGAVTAPPKAPEAPSVPQVETEPPAEEPSGAEETEETEPAQVTEQPAPVQTTPPAPPPPADDGRARVVLSTPAKSSEPTQKPATNESTEAPSVWGSAAEQPTDGKTGTLRIRTNVRALVKVDGGPEQYASRPLELSVGTHEITAFRPGRMDTAKSKTVEVKAGETVTVQFSF